jgi:hypothetical protein
MATVKQRLGALAQRFKPHVSAFSLPLLVACGFLAWFGYRISWTRFASKTFWDWLDLLIIPAVLAIGAFLFNRAERRSEQRIATQRAETDRQIADERSQESALQTYLDRMTELLLREPSLRNSQEDDEVRTVARARTLTVLSGLNGRRKGALLRFLSESALVQTKAGEDPSEPQKAPIISLSRAALSRAVLIGTNLRGADLSGADLTGATGTINQQLAKAASLIGATLPDGTKIETEEQWQEFKAKYGNQE